MAPLTDDAGETFGNIPSRLSNVANHEEPGRGHGTRYVPHGLPDAPINSCFDDVHQMMNESSANFCQKWGRISRGQRQSERRIKANRPQYNVNQPSSSGENDL
ncbi:unnamed protein product [Protopolystoma xenopodis]|uniref:Uncharacterized protein n=1 Tax=Protopolystoma xenopodis TaxID=117903 RepID=A0A3S5B3N5_9PLAT|nr:unnamed protein product [Protopolystoma xenopodis]